MIWLDLSLEFLLIALLMGGELKRKYGQDVQMLPSEFDGCLKL